MQSVKIVVVGDGAVGKSTFLISFTLDCFPQEYVPTVFDNFTTVYSLENRPISLGLWDTAGQEDFASMRPLFYPGTDIFLVFYSCAMRPSFENVKDKWIPEFKATCPTTPFFLIASQIDLREAKNPNHVTTKEGKKLAKDCGAQEYFELSSKDNSTFRGIWDEMLRCVINEKRCGKEQGKHCWSIHCHDKIDLFSKIKCSGVCQHYYCNDCLENWDDGHKICIQCEIYEKAEREKNGKPIVVKKKRVAPEDKVSEQAKELNQLYAKEIAKREKEREKEKNQQDGNLKNS